MALPVIYVVLSVLQVLAMLLTCFRVTFRVWIGRFWWEDAWATVAIVFGVLCLITMYTHDSSNQTLVFASGLIYMYSWPGIVWSVRLSLIASVARIVQPGRLRLFTLASGWLFAAEFFAVATQKTYLCVSALEKLHHGLFSSPTCWADKGLAITEFTTDVIADAILIALPLRVLWGVRLERRQRRMIMAIFLSNASVTVVSALHAVTAVVPAARSWQGIATIAEILVSLVMCNLLVIVTLVYRTLVREHTSVSQTSQTSVATGVGVDSDDDDNDDDFTQPRTRPAESRTSSGLNPLSQFLTTVELSITSSWRTMSESRASQKTK